jgi:chromosome condensin MukBEF ATPase and DNA-binding subunit MukB
MEDSPPPEGDAKLRDRLQDYEGEKDQERHRVLANHSDFDKQAEGIKRWASSFGVKDELINQALSALLEVRVAGEDSKPKKEEVLEMVQKTIGSIIAFK